VADSHQPASQRPSSQSARHQPQPASQPATQPCSLRPASRSPASQPARQPMSNPATQHARQSTCPQASQPARTEQANLPAAYELHDTQWWECNLNDKKFLFDGRWSVFRSTNAKKGTTLVRTSIIYKKARLNISKIIRIISFSVWVITIVMRITKLVK
jgi:hypothetical protein